MTVLPVPRPRISPADVRKKRRETAQLNLDVPFAGLEYYDTAASTWKPVSSSAEQAEVDRVKAEALADAQSELDDIKFYPMIKLGFMYRF